MSVAVEVWAEPNVEEQGPPQAHPPVEESASGSSNDDGNEQLKGEVPVSAQCDNTSTASTQDEQHTADSDLSDTAEAECERAPTTPRAISPEETILIFDWDDTILPSTWIQENNLRLDGTTDEQKEILDAVATSAINLIEIAKRFGTVVLITNADHGWIELSCQKFIPRLLPFLEGLKMTSARAAYEAQGVTSPFEWKIFAFGDEIHSFFREETSARPHVISLGDSAHEREAVLRVCQEIPNCRTKSLKFMERPTVDQLKKQHELVTGCFGDIAKHDGNLDLCIRCM